MHACVSLFSHYPTSDSVLRDASTAVTAHTPDVSYHPLAIQCSFYLLKGAKHIPISGASTHILL